MVQLELTMFPEGKKYTTQLVKVCPLHIFYNVCFDNQNNLGCYACKKDFICKMEALKRIYSAHVYFRSETLQLLLIVEDTIPTFCEEANLFSCTNIEI